MGAVVRSADGEREGFVVGGGEGSSVGRLVVGSGVGCVDGGRGVGGGVGGGVGRSVGCGVGGKDGFGVGGGVGDGVGFLVAATATLSEGFSATHRRCQKGVRVIN